MKPIKIVLSSTEPEKNVIWVKNDGSLLKYISGKWVCLNNINSSNDNTSSDNNEETTNLAIIEISSEAIASLEELAKRIDAFKTAYMNLSLTDELVKSIEDTGSVQINILGASTRIRLLLIDLDETRLYLGRCLFGPLIEYQFMIFGTECMIFMTMPYRREEDSLIVYITQNKLQLGIYGNPSDPSHYYYYMFENDDDFIIDQNQFFNDLSLLYRVSKEVLYYNDSGRYVALEFDKKNKDSFVTVNGHVYVGDMGDTTNPNNKLSIPPGGFMKLKIELLPSRTNLFYNITIFRENTDYKR